jgi:hypothetical protein
VLDLRGQRQNDGYLEAIEPGESVEGSGVKWKCFCHLCKRNYRKVLARDFTSQRIKKCSKCVNPIFRKVQRRLIETRRKKLRELGKPWYSEYTPSLNASWRIRIADFTPAQRLLFDVILDGRTGFQFSIQAIDWVLRTKDIRLELTQFGAARVLRNLSNASRMHRERRKVS